MYSDSEDDARCRNFKRILQDLNRRSYKSTSGFINIRCAMAMAVTKKDDDIDVLRHSLITFIKTCINQLRWVMKKLQPEHLIIKRRLYFTHLLFIFLLQSICLVNSFAETENKTLVTTADISTGILQTEQVFIGSIHFSQTSLLASKTQGMVLKVNFDTTSKMHQGDVLVELDHEILDSKIKALQASLKELKLLKEKS
ncbi:MAG: hypothetical protein KZQ69_15255 [gamma proteobacterium symbiont of Bathyaustriella thionipta]|nr:hypothetical protein [gamma proteobacterium symbiont of Bathyaustriella thionipta]